MPVSTAEPDVSDLYGVGSYCCYDGGIWSGGAFDGATDEGNRCPQGERCTFRPDRQDVLPGIYELGRVGFPDSLSARLPVYVELVKQFCLPDNDQLVAVSAGRWYYPADNDADRYSIKPGGLLRATVESLRYE